jgi:hypothetical protein
MRSVPTQLTRRRRREEEREPCRIAKDHSTCAHSFFSSTCIALHIQVYRTFRHPTTLLHAGVHTRFKNIDACIYAHAPPRPACSVSTTSVSEPGVSAVRKLRGPRAHAHARSRKAALRVLLQFFQVQHGRSGLSSPRWRRLRASAHARAAACLPAGTQGGDLEVQHLRDSALHARPTSLACTAPAWASHHALRALFRLGSPHVRASENIMVCGPVEIAEAGGAWSSVFLHQALRSC